MKKRILAIVLAGVMTLGFFSGCSAVKTDDQAQNTSSGGSKTAAVSGKDPYSGSVKVAFLPNVIGDSCAAAWADGMKDYLSSFSNVKLDVFDGKASVDTEVQIMDELINQKYDAILLQATDASGLAASTKKAEAAGIPVITVNLDANTPHTALVAAVDVEAGREIAENIGKSLNGKGNVVIISATPGATKGENIDKGFKAAMKEKYPDIKILDEQTGNWLTEDANTVMNDFLTKYPNVDAVLCHNDAMAEGAAEAIKAGGKLGKIQVWGCDGESKMLKYIEQGLCTGTIYTNCHDQGILAAQMAMYSIGAGKSGTASSTPIVKMSPTVVTKSNVSSITEDMRW
ncbi:Sugar ABC transporter substrate-binding protein [Ruminococcaceae bacterium BL-6]|nr:Sugar ABC transporter substrate-binding protein [Ruminococcaceae bacterium BL-6]